MAKVMKAKCSDIASQYEMWLEEADREEKACAEYQIKEAMRICDEEAAKYSKSYSADCPNNMPCADKCPYMWPVKRMKVNGAQK